MDKEYVTKWGSHPLMIDFVMYLIHWMARHWSIEAVEAIHAVIINGWELPLFKHERSFWGWHERLLRYIAIAERIKTYGGYVYLFEGISKETGNVLAYKIGRSNAPQKRVANVFGGKQPFVDVRIVHTIKTDDGDLLESRLHKQYAEKRIGGEWFKLDEMDINAIQQLKGVIYYLDVEADDFKKSELYDLLQTLKTA